MKSIILKIILAGLTGLGLQSLIVFIQYVFGPSHSNGRNILIELGFPYRFYYFTSDHTFEAFSRNHLIYDLFVSVLFSFLIILIAGRMIRKRKNKSESANLMDDTTSE